MIPFSSLYNLQITKYHIELHEHNPMLVHQPQPRDCGMLFQTVSQLENHKRKFCTNSKYAAIDQLEKQFGEISQNRDLSKFGKMSLAMRGRTYDLQKNQQNTNKLQDEYRTILKQIDQQKSLKSRLDFQRNKAFHQLQALQKKQQQLIIDDKYDNLQDIIGKRQQLARQQQQLQKQINQYQRKKMQWEQSSVKVRQVIDQPYEQGVKVGKINFERTMLEERKYNMELQLNAKRRQKQKLQNRILQMSNVQQTVPLTKKSNHKPNPKPNSQLKSPKPTPPPPPPPLSQPKSSQPKSITPPYPQSQIAYSKVPRDRAIFTSQLSKTSSYLQPAALNGTQKILKFNLNKQGKSEQDKLIQSIMAQQYDDLMILSKLPKGSELYNIKMKQYVQLSKQRMEVQQKAQKQRIQKMKRQFEFEKLMQQKQKINTEWVDNSRKIFIKKQLAILQNKQQQQQQQQQYQQNLITNNSIQLPPTNPNIQTHNSIHPNQQLNQNPSTRKTQQLNIQSSLTNKSNSKQNSKSYPYPPQKKISERGKDPFGFRISVLALKNYSMKKPIKIKIIIYEEYYHQNQKGLKYQFNTIYHDENADQFNPNFKNKLDLNGSIAYNQSFYVPQNLQILYNKNQKQIYLLVIAAEKDQRKMSNEAIPYCWYSFKITHFGQIKQGRYTVNLYADEMVYPYPADMNKMKKKKQQQLLFQLQQILLNEQLIQSIKKNQPPITQTSKNIPPPESNNKPRTESQRTAKASIEQNIPKTFKQIGKSTNSEQLDLNSSKMSKMEMNYPLKMKNIASEEVIKINQLYFHSNEKPTEFVHIRIKKPLNFDISVTGLRTLPSYVGPIKLELSLIDIDNSLITPKQQFLADIGNDLYNPTITYTKQIRNQSRIPPSTIIFIRLITISALDYQIYSLGFTPIYLFLDKAGNTIKKNTVNDYLMTSGCYQLPIFWGNIEPQYIDINDLLNYYPPIPCASILVAIQENASKITNPPPTYDQKVYNTILFQVDQNQAKLFEQQYKRQPLDSNTLLSEYLHYKGIKKNYSGQQTTKYIDKTLSFSLENTKKQFQLKWMSQYQQYFGINFIIDKLSIPEQKNKFYYYFITICIAPPGEYYKKKSFDLLFCRKINFLLSRTNQYYYKDNQFFINPNYYKNSSIIIQINRIQIFENAINTSDSNIEGYAYTVIPLFELQQNIPAVNVMKEDFVLNLGDFDANNIQKVQKDLPGFLQKMSKNKKSKATISIRMLNGFFMNQFMPVMPDPTNKMPMYQDIVPEGMDFDTALDHCMNVIGNNYNLQINDY